MSWFTGGSDESLNVTASKMTVLYPDTTTKSPTFNLEHENILVKSFL